MFFPKSYPAFLPNTGTSGCPSRSTQTPPHLPGEAVVAVARGTAYTASALVGALRASLN